MTLDVISYAAAQEALQRRPKAVTVQSLPEPWVMAHRMGGQNISPDNALEAMDTVIRQGHRICDGGDVFALKDGVLAAMHDTTVDRTTTGTGNAADYVSTAWKLLRIDAETWFSSAWAGRDMRPPFFEDILELAARTGVVITPENKDSSSTMDATSTAMVAAIKRYKLERQVIFQSFNPTTLVAPAAAGIKTLLLQNTTSRSAATVASMSPKPDYFGYDYTVAGFDATYLQTVAAAGIKLAPWTMDRRTDLTAEAAAKGVTIAGVASNDPLWVAGTSPFLTTDPFATKTWYHGQLGYDGASRGAFIGTDRWGFNLLSGNYWCLQGWGSRPAAPTSITYSITYDTRGTDTSRWAGIAFGCTDDSKFNDGASVGNGYVAFMRQTGDMQISRRDGATSTALVASSGVAQQSAAPAVTFDGETRQFQVSFRAGGVVRFTEVASGHYIETTDTTYRGGFWHLGQSPGSAGSLHSFSDITIVP